MTRRKQSNLTRRVPSKKGTCFLRVIDMSGSIVAHYTAEKFNLDILKKARRLIQDIDGSYIQYTQAGFKAMKELRK